MRHAAPRNRTGRIAGLQPTVGGDVYVEGHAIGGLRGGELRRLRRRVQVIFQDPHAVRDPTRAKRRALNVVGAIADRIGVMYLGGLVEISTARALFDAPRHPYTRALLRAIPLPDPERRRSTDAALEGEIPSPHHPPSGCRFHTRCPMVRADRCTTEEPALSETDTGLVACHWWRELAGRAL